jgi:hypothetical protein
MVPLLLQQIATWDRRRPACRRATLSERIEQIMSDRMVKHSFVKKCLMAIMGFAAIVGPFAVGLAGGPLTVAQSGGE